MRYLASFSNSSQFGIFGAFGRRRDPDVYKMEGHRSFHENPLILSS